MTFTCVPGLASDDSERMVGPADTVLHAPSGTFIHNDLAGDLSLTLHTVNAVSIANLADVAEYCISRDGSVVTHRVRFHGGGELEASFGLDGELSSLSGERVCLTANHFGVIAAKLG